MNSDGSSISTTRKKNILYFKNNAFIAENRYFIKIHNQRNIRSSGSINIRYTTDTTASPKTSHKDATNIASSHKRHQQKSTKSSSSRNASRLGAPPLLGYRRTPHSLLRSSTAARLMLPSAFSVHPSGYGFPFSILISFVSFTFLFPPSDLFSILFQYSTNNSCMPPQVTV